jgi:apolipoprotein N-acyltransferase
LASLLKKNNSTFLVNILTPFLFGAINFLSFAPFDFKFLAIISYGYVAYLFKQDLSNRSLFSRLLIWGFSFWIFGTGWIIVSIYYYGNISIYLSFIAIVLLSIFLAIVFITPLALFNNLIKASPISLKAVVFASCFLVTELLRYFLFGGFPWLSPGLIVIDTFYQIGIPFIGVFGMSFFIYYFAYFFVNETLPGTSIKLIIFLVLVSLSYIEIPSKSISNAEIEINLVQPAIDLNTKYSINSSEDIVDTLFSYSVLESKVLNIWPETPLPFDSGHPHMGLIRNYLNQNNYTVLGGSWRFQGEKLFNTLEIYNTGDFYSKRRLVPFGEFVPLSSVFNSLFDLLELPMSYVSAGKDNKIMEINGHKFISAICFDIAYPFSFIKVSNNYQFIVNISNDTWFGSSYGPSQHLQITRARAVEHNKYLLRSTNDGISAIIDNNGTIVDKLDKGVTGNVKGKILLNDDISFYVTHGWWLSLGIPCFIIIFSYIFRRKVENTS